MDKSRVFAAIRAGSVDPFFTAAYHKDSPSPPAAPDYKGAAVATQQSSMVNQNTPYGSLTYSPDSVSRFPDQPSYTSTIDLSPTGEKLLDTQNQAALGLGTSINKALGSVQGQGPMDQNSVQATADRAYKNYTARLDPQWEHQQATTETQLRNQGLVPGDEAYDAAMRDFNNAKNDAYTQANTASINTMPQTYQLASSQYNQPLNYLNALRTGAQVTNPQFTPPTAGANFLGAAQGQGQYGMGLYNAGVGQANAFNSGLFNIGAAAIGAPAGTFSDRRLKSNVERIGTHPLGIGIYEYDIFDRRERGVMADEVLTVRPEAVSVHPSGFYMVDYGRL
jgi:hypothetical protein